MRVSAGLVIVADRRLPGRGRNRIQRLRQAEVEHLDGAIGPHLDVGRLRDRDG